MHTVWQPLYRRAYRPGSSKVGCQLELGAVRGPTMLATRRLLLIADAARPPHPRASPFIPAHTMAEMASNLYWPCPLHLGHPGNEPGCTSPGPNLDSMDPIHAMHSCHHSIAIRKSSSASQPLHPVNCPVCCTVSLEAHLQGPRALIKANKGFRVLDTKPQDRTYRGGTGHHEQRHT